MLTFLMVAASAARPPSDLLLVELDAEDIGGPRSAWVRVPSGSGPWRVVFAFHGGHRADRGREMEHRIRSAYADDLLVVYPNGTPWERGSPVWAALGHAEGDLAMRDVNFARALVEEVDRRWDIDRDKVYAAGFSNGAFLTDALFCQASDVFHGFLVVARAMPIPLVATCTASPPRPVLFVVGTADTSLVGQHQLSIDDSIAFYRTKLGCEAEPRGDGPPIYGPATTRFWSQCAPGAALAVREIQGMDHGWPSGDAASGGFDAAPAFMDFLRGIPAAGAP